MKNCLINRAGIKRYVHKKGKHVNKQYLNELEKEIELILNNDCHTGRKRIQRLLFLF